MAYINHSDLFLPKEKFFSPINLNVNDHILINEPINHHFSNYSLYKKLIETVELLSNLEIVLEMKGANIIHYFEKKIANVRNYIIKQKQIFENLIFEINNSLVTEELKNKILKIKSQNPNEVFNSSKSLFEKIDEWFNVQILKFNENDIVIPVNIPPPPPPIPPIPVNDFISDFRQPDQFNNNFLSTPNHTQRPTPARGSTNLSVIENNQMFNEEILMTTSINQNQVYVISTSTCAYRAVGVEGVANSPYWPVLQKIKPQTYFFYGGLINRNPIGRCYMVFVGETLSFSEKRDFIPRSYASAVLYRDFIYVFGGSNFHVGNAREPIRDCSKYSVLNDRWSTITPLDMPAYKNSSSFIFDRIFIAQNSYENVLEYIVNEDLYISIFHIGYCEMLLLAERWVIKRNSPDLLEITENGIRTHRMQSYWDTSRWPNLELQSNIFKREGNIFLVEHTMIGNPKLFRLDTIEKTFYCILD